MWPVSPAWLAALSQPHGRYTRVEAWYAGAKVGVIPVESGSVQVTARNRVRRTLSAVVQEAYWPTGVSSALAPYGAQLRVFQGITGVNGQLIPPEVPVFTGRVEKIDRTRFAGKITVTANDPFADVNDAQFEQPRTAPAGADIVSTLAGLINEVLPAVNVANQTVSGAALPIAMTWDTDRGQAIDDLAAAIGAEVFFTPDGDTAVVRAVPMLGGTPVWTLTQGVNSTIVRDSATRSRTDVANRIVVHVEQPGQTPLTVTVSDNDANSATRYGGPYGTVVRHYRNALIADTGQAGVAGQARLARYLGATRTRDVDLVPNPALEAGDQLAITTNEGTELHIADSFPVPLSVADVMTITTRSTGTSVT